MSENMIVGGGSASDKARIELATRKGTPIPNERRRPWPPERMAAAVKMLTAAHPEMRVRSASSVYNCMGLVFASRRTWIWPKYALKILEDDGYRRLGSVSEIEIGDVVLYRDDDGGAVVHVAVVASVERDLRAGEFIINVMSQWGADGEYLHLMDDVHQEMGRPVEFWTDRVQLR